MSRKVVNFNMSAPDGQLLKDINRAQKELKNEYEETRTIDAIENALRKYALSDLKNISKIDNVLASFMVASCFIEQMTYFCFNKVDGDKFRQFVKKYLPSSYDPKKLRVDLRNRLVHNYTLGESYILVQRHSELHLKPHDEKQIINLENFIDELESALNKLMADLNTPDSIQRKMAILAFNESGIVDGSTMEVKH